jgi:hypothetical protein
MKPLATSMALISLPFAAKGFTTQDSTAWATAFLALLLGIIFAWLDQRITTQNT